MLENWGNIQMLMVQFIYDKTPDITTLPDVHPIKGFCQRIKGKQGRFCGNLSGKRVDFSARTVTSPDPNLSCNHVGVPRHVAMIMTFPEMASWYTLDRLKAKICNSPKVHPGTNSVRLANGLVQNLSYGDPDRATDQLLPSFVVERQGWRRCPLQPSTLAALRHHHGPQGRCHALADLLVQHLQLRSLHCGL